MKVFFTGDNFKSPDRGSVNPTPLGGWIGARAGIDWLDGSVQAWRLYGLGLQVSLGLGDEVSFSRCLPATLVFAVANCCTKTARAHEMAVHAGSINRDHVHMLLSIPPSLSVSRAVRRLKGRSSHKLLSEFGVLRRTPVGPASVGEGLLGGEQRQRHG